MNKFDVSTMTITFKLLKSVSTSEYKKINDFLEENYKTNPDECVLKMKPIIEQLKQDQMYLKNNETDKLSDCALFAPRHSSKFNNRDNKIRFAEYCANEYFIKTGKMKEQLHANIHWQRLCASLSKAYVENQKNLAMIKAEFKTHRLLEHTRKNWCELKNRKVQTSVAKPTAMPVDVAPLEELQPFFDHLSENKAIEFKQFQRGTVFSDGRMDLCKQVVGPTWIGHLMESLKTNDKIEHFLLGNNITGSQGGIHIKNFLLGERKCKIKTWYLAGSDFDTEACKNICEGLINDTDCEALWLKRNPIYADGMIFIKNLLKVNKTIQILDLHNCGVGFKKEAYFAKESEYDLYKTSDGIKELFEGLKDNTTLKHLYLDANGLTADSCKYIAEYFDYKKKTGQKGINSLWIDMNVLGDDGIRIIVESLNGYSYLKRLCIGAVYMSNVGMSYVSDNLKNSPSLKILDLSLYKATADMGTLPNNISNDGVLKVCEFIESTNVEYLNISMNNIDSEHMELIAHSLEKNNSIKYFHYKQYGQEIKQNVVKLIDKCINRNRSLVGGEYTNETLRLLKHSEKILNIDSIYRNSMK